MRLNSSLDAQQAPRLNSRINRGRRRRRLRGTIAPYVEGYAVATIDEAINLRRHGIQKMILVLGVTHESRFEDLVRGTLTVDRGGVTKLAMIQSS